MRNKISRSTRLLSLQGRTFDRITIKFLLGLGRGDVSRNFMKLFHFTSFHFISRSFSEVLLSIISLSFTHQEPSEVVSPDLKFYFILLDELLNFNERMPPGGIRAIFFYILK